MPKKYKIAPKEAVDDSRPRGIRFETYKDANSEHRWRMIDGNNRIVGVSGESFTRAADARRSITNIMVDLADSDLGMGLTSAKK